MKNAGSEILGNGKWPFDFAQGKRVLSGEWREKSLEEGDIGVTWRR